MNVDKYKDQHNEILRYVQSLRHLIKAGIAEHANEISELIVTMSSGIKFHLAAEDNVLYPALAAASDPRIVQMSKRYQTEMTGIAGVYTEFAKKWRVGNNIAAAPEEFRNEANAVFKALHERIQKENTELYPAAESL